MDTWFLLKCFIIGISASSGVGPIFILTFNRGALYGFPKGFASACGAAIADGIYFALGLFGTLALLEQSKHSMLILDFFGGFILIIIGALTLKRYSAGTQISYIANRPAYLIAAKSFVITILNPFIVLFFIFICVQILPEGVSRLPWYDIIMGSTAVFLGSLSVLGSVAWLASHMKNVINMKKLRSISYFSALLFIGFGIYLLGDFVVDIFKKIAS